MPLPPTLSGDTWTHRTAVLMLPILVSRAHQGRTITYGEVDKEIVTRRWGHHVHAAAYGKPAGAIGDAMVETGKKWRTMIPPINALVVNHTTGIPGSGCDWYLLHVLEKRQRALTDEDRKALAEAVHLMVFNFNQWDELLAEYGLRPLRDKVRPKNHRTGVRRKPNCSSEGESEAHRRLVELIANEPSVLSLSWNPPVGIRDHLFLSGDRPDVVLRDDAHFLAVEVKSVISNDDDVVRGIYQCVKYRALARAEQTANHDIPNARSLLVVGRQVSKTIWDLAVLHTVPVAVITGMGRTH